MMVSAFLSGIMTLVVNLVNVSTQYRIIASNFGHTFKSIATVSLNSLDMGMDTTGLSFVL